MTIGGLNLPWPPDPGVLLSAEQPSQPPLLRLRLAAALPAQGRGARARLASRPTSRTLSTSRLIGRGISGIFDTAMIAMVFALGARLYDRRTGLLAAVFVAFTVLHIQLSHFYTVDTLLTFFIVLAMMCAVEVARRGSLRRQRCPGRLPGSGAGHQGQRGAVRADRWRWPGCCGWSAARRAPAASRRPGRARCLGTVAGRSAGPSRLCDRRALRGPGLGELHQARR